MVLIFFLPKITRKKYCFTLSEIALDYLKFWFWVDLLGNLPFGVILGQEENPDLSSPSFRFIHQIPRLYKVFRLLKLLRISRM